MIGEANGSGMRPVPSRAGREAVRSGFRVPAREGLSTSFSETVGKAVGGLGAFRSTRATFVDSLGGGHDPKGVWMPGVSGRRDPKAVSEKRGQTWESLCL